MTAKNDGIDRRRGARTPEQSRYARLQRHLGLVHELPAAARMALPLHRLRVEHAAQHDSGIYGHAYEAFE